MKTPKVPKDRKLTKSEYLEKVLSDPAIVEATKAEIRAANPLYEVMSDNERFELAQDILRDDDRLAAITAKLQNGEAITAEEITALIMIQNVSAEGEEQADAAFIVATAGRLAGRALRSFNRHLRPYAEMEASERYKALLADTKADATHDAFKVQNEFIDYKLHKGAGDYIDQVVIKFHAERGLKALSAEKLGEKTVEIIKSVEDIKRKDGRYEGEEVKDRVKGRLLKAFEDPKLQAYLHNEIQSGTKPIDAIRLAINKALRIKSLTNSEIKTVTNSEIKTVMGYAEEIAKLCDRWYDATSLDEALEINAELNGVEMRMFEYIAEHMTVSGFERARAWRKTAMLSNLRTHVRNSVANLAMLPVQRMDHKVAALLEKSVFRKHGFTDHTILTWSSTKFGKEIKDMVEKYTAFEMTVGSRYLGYATELSSEKKKDGKETDEKSEYYFDFDKTEIAMRRRMFGARENVLNRISDFNSRALEKEDAVFYKMAFRSALGQIMTASKATEPNKAMLHGAGKAGYARCGYG